MTALSGWTEVTLQDVATSALGKMLDKAKARGVQLPYLRNQNVRWDGFDLSDVYEMPFEEDEFERFGVRAGDLLICEGGEPGRAAVWNDATLDMKFQKALHRVRPSEALDARFLLHRLRLDAATGELNDYFTGTTIKHLTGVALGRYRFRLPPINEQRRIVAKLDAIFDQTRAAKARIEGLPALLDKLKRSILAAAFRGDLTADWRAAHHDVEPKTLPPIQRPMSDQDADEDHEHALSDDDLGPLPPAWQWAEISQLAAQVPRAIQSGPFGSNLRHSEFTPDGCLVIGIDNVLAGRFSKGSENRIPVAKFEELRKYEARPGDVLITVMATVGRCAVVPADIEPSIITKHVYRITCDQETVLPEFLMLALMGCADVLKQLGLSVRGQTRAGINGGILKRLRVPLPCRAEQLACLKRVNALLAHVESLQRVHLRSGQRVADLERAALTKAFRGELVPQDPTDEPAASLLDRIRAAAEHDAKTNAAKSTRAAAKRTRVKAHGAAAESES